MYILHVVPRYNNYSKGPTTNHYYYTVINGILIFFLRTLYIYIYIYSNQTNDKLKVVATRSANNPYSMLHAQTIQ